MSKGWFRTAVAGLAGQPTLWSGSDEILTMAQVSKAIMEEAEGDIWQQQAQAESGSRVSRQAYRDYGEASFFYASVFAIMSAGASAPYVFRRETKDGEFEEVENELLTRITTQPNPTMTWYDLLEATYAYLELSGEMYWEIARGEGKQLALYPIRPDLLSPRGDEGEFISHYVYRDPSTSQERKIDPDDIIRFVYFHPTSFKQGMGSAEPCAQAADTIIRASKWNRKFFTDSAVPEGSLTTDQKLSPKEVKQLWQMWANRHQGESKQRRPAILWGGLKWEPLGITHKDMDFRELIDQGREDVLAAMGVPPILVGWLRYVNYNTASVQDSIFWKQTMLPKLTKVQGALTMQLLPLLQELTGISDLVGFYDLEEIPALHEAKNDQHERVRADFRDGLITRNEARTEIQYEAVDDARGDLFYDEIEAKRMGGMFGGAASKSDDAIPAFKTIPGETHVEKASRQQKVFEAGRAKQYRMLYPLVSDFYREEGKRVLAAWEKMSRKRRKSLELDDAEVYVTKAADLFDPEIVEDAGRLAKALRAEPDEHGQWVDEEHLGLLAKFEVDLDDLLNDLGPAEKQRLGELLSKAGMITMNEGGKVAIVGMLGKKIGDWSLSEASYLDFIEHSFAAAGGAVDTARMRVARTMAKGLSEGWTSATIARELRSTYEGLSVNHSAMIAQTETQGAYGMGAVDGYRFAGIEKKKWLTSGSGNEREDHLAADGQTVPINEPFIVGGEALMFPGDYAGSFGQTHGCECAVAPVVEEA